jgi:hypothetical protein
VSRADWCARSVREIQTKSGRESRPTVLPLPDRTHNESSKEAHIWHTKRRREANTPGVLEKVSLIGANQGRKSISSFRMIQNSERDWQYSEQRIPAILGALRREENALWSLFDEKSRDFARKYTDGRSPNVKKYSDSMAVLGVECKPLSGREFPVNREIYRENPLYSTDVLAVAGPKVPCLETLPPFRRLCSRN